MSAENRPWTQGPWEVDPKRSLRVVAPGGVTVASTGTQTSIRDEWEANAYIMAAAPALYEALVLAELALVNSIPVVPYPGDGPLVKIREAMRAALPK